MTKFGCDSFFTEKCVLLWTAQDFNKMFIPINIYPG